MKQILQHIKQFIFHKLKLYPIYKVIDAINQHYPLKGCSALEAFAFKGEWQTQAFSHLPAYLEAWEISEDCRADLEKNLPNATIKITNSFEELLRCKTKFNFINVDTNSGIFGNYCENFEFFPLMFHVTADECVVNLNVMPYASEEWRKRYTGLFNEEHLARRKAFYEVENPAEITLNQMLAAYGKIAGQHQYKIVWHFYLKRTLTYYLVLHLKRQL